MSNYSPSPKPKATDCPVHIRLVAAAAKKIGARFEITNNAGSFYIRVSYKKKVKLFGTTPLFKYPLNNAVAVSLAKDKIFTYQLLERHNLKVPKGDYFFSDRHKKFTRPVTNNLKKKTIKKALLFASKISYPVFVKPNSFFGGLGCQLAKNRRTLKQALKAAFSYDHLVLVQKYIAGREFRLVVLNKKVLLLYEKTAPFVVGDGRHSLRQLITTKTRNNIIFNAADVWRYLHQQGIRRSAIISPNKKIFLTDVANLSSGGEIVREFVAIPALIKKIARQTAQALNLNFFAIDLRCNDLLKFSDCVVLEVNGNPSFNEFYLYNPDKTLNIYEKMLRAAFRME